MFCKDSVSEQLVDQAKTLPKVGFTDFKCFYFSNTLMVAWMHFEQSAILTVHNHVITRNPRISVTHDKHRTWFLHISNVQEEDKGRYMCQINTVTAKTQFGYLHVVALVGDILNSVIPQGPKRNTHLKSAISKMIDANKRNKNV
ncbi:hypothetical protein NQ317_009754 [Molorchus minor]|uniref:Immunoglobulin domain-containing protein n=1 Tax=Molorchus minor TaxID=1323400 RepID=A0ABQ9K1V5_9CUCU|nr:hypothetical protein NQ317_009754 [Molorchus minor]